MADVVGAAGLIRMVERVERGGGSSSSNSNSSSTCIPANNLPPLRPLQNQPDISLSSFVSSTHTAQLFPHRASYFRC